MQPRPPPTPPMRSTRKIDVCPGHTRHVRSPDAFGISWNPARNRKAGQLTTSPEYKYYFVHNFDKMSDNMTVSQMEAMMQMMMAPLARNDQLDALTNNANEFRQEVVDTNAAVEKVDNKVDNMEARVSGSPDSSTSEVGHFRAWAPRKTCPTTNLLLSRAPSSTISTRKRKADANG